MKKNSIRAAAAAAALVTSLVAAGGTAAAASPQRISSDQLQDSLQQAIALERAQGAVAAGGPTAGLVAQVAASVRENRC